MVVLINVERQERHLLDRAPLALGALSKKENGKQHREGEAHKDGYGEYFHVALIKAQGRL
jgi:hypothetical protein